MHRHRQNSSVSGLTWLRYTQDTLLHSKTKTEVRQGTRDTLLPVLLPVMHKIGCRSYILCIYVPPGKNSRSTANKSTDENASCVYAVWRVLGLNLCIYTPCACLCVSTVPERCMWVFSSCVAVMRLDFWAGESPTILGLGLAVGLLHTLDISCRENIIAQVWITSHDPLPLYIN